MLTETLYIFFISNSHVNRRSYSSMIICILFLSLAYCVCALHSTVKCVLRTVRLYWV